MGQDLSTPKQVRVDDNTLTNIDDITKVFEDSSSNLSTDLSLTMSSTVRDDVTLDGGGTAVVDAALDKSLSNQVPLRAGHYHDSDEDTLPSDAKGFEKVVHDGAIRILGGKDSDGAIKEAIAYIDKVMAREIHRGANKDKNKKKEDTVESIPRDAKKEKALLYLIIRSDHDLDKQKNYRHFLRTIVQKENDLNPYDFVRTNAEIAADNEKTRAQAKATAAPAAAADSDNDEDENKNQNENDDNENDQEEDVKTEVNGGSLKGGASSLDNTFHAPLSDLKIPNTIRERFPMPTLRYKVNSEPYPYEHRYSLATHVRPASAF